MKDQDDVDRANRKWFLLFFETNKSDPPVGLPKMSEITPEQAAAAVRHTQDHGGEIEVYLADEDRLADGDCPAIGFYFEGGCYTGYGLGDDDVMSHEEDAQKLPKPADYQSLVKFFADCVSP